MFETLIFNDITCEKYLFSDENIVKMFTNYNIFAKKGKTLTYEKYLFWVI
jgi:hypothetical protein